MVTPPTPKERVLQGRDGWLFLQHDTNDIIGQHTGDVGLGRKGRRAWSAVLSERISVIRRYRVVWVCQIAPDKESVYPEYLPREIELSRRRPVHELLRVARHVGAPLTYPVEALMRAKADGHLYFLTDTHWNQRGAYAAYRVITTELKRRGVEPLVVPDDSIDWIARPHVGDLGRKLDPPLEGMGTFAQLKHHSSELVFDNRIDNHGRVMIFEQARSSGPTCVVFGESFTNHLLLFLKESFRRLVFVHTSMLIPEVIEWEAPDAVVSLPLERFLIQIPSDSRALPDLVETINGKLARGRLRGFPMPYLLGCAHPEQDTLERQAGTLPWPSAAHALGTPLDATTD